MGPDKRISKKEKKMIKTIEVVARYMGQQGRADLLAGTSQ